MSQLPQIMFVNYFSVNQPSLTSCNQLKGVKFGSNQSYNNFKNPYFGDCWPQGCHKRCNFAFQFESDPAIKPFGQTFKHFQVSPIALLT